MIELMSKKVLNDVEGAIEAIKMSYTRWPKDLCKQATIISRACGDLCSAVLHDDFIEGGKEHLREYAETLAAYAIRFLESLPEDLTIYDPEDYTYCEGCDKLIRCDNAHLDSEGIELCDGCWNQLVKDTIAEQEAK